jgi:ubiquinone/menaquinone biosynthesis C-methylase UbiE
MSPQEFYDSFAQSYDSVLDGSEVNVQYLHEAVQLFNKHHQNAAGTILDLGCGTGHLKELLQGEFQFTGIDVSSNMLYYAFKRGYAVNHISIEDALSEISSNSYDFVFALGALLFIEDIDASLAHIQRIARRAVVLSLDVLTPEYLETVKVAVYNHSQLLIPAAKENYVVRGWISPTTGVTVMTRMIYIPKYSSRQLP